MAVRRPQVKRPRRGRTSGGGQTFIQRSRRVPAAEKAAYHSVTGAGRSGVIRDFMGLTADDEQRIVNRLEQFIAAQISAA